MSKVGSAIWRLLNSRIALILGGAWLADKALMPRVEDTRPKQPIPMDRKVRSRTWYAVRLKFLLPKSLGEILTGVDRALDRFYALSDKPVCSEPCDLPIPKRVRRVHVLKGSLVGGVAEAVVDFAILDPLDPMGAPTLGQVAMALARETGGAVVDAGSLGMDWPGTPPDIKDAPTGLGAIVVGVDKALLVVAGGAALAIAGPKIIEALKRPAPTSTSTSTGKGA